MGSRLPESKAGAQPGKFPQPLPFLREGSSWKAPALQEERGRKWMKVLTVVASRVLLRVAVWKGLWAPRHLRLFVLATPEEAVGRGQGAPRG